jgi:hypothetical protein
VRNPVYARHETYTIGQKPDTTLIVLLKYLLQNKSPGDNSDASPQTGADAEQILVSFVIS